MLDILPDQPWADESLCVHAAYYSCLLCRRGCRHVLDNCIKLKPRNSLRHEWLANNANVLLAIVPYGPTRSVCLPNKDPKDRTFNIETTVVDIVSADHGP